MTKIFKYVGYFILLLIVILIIPSLIPDDEYTREAKQWLDIASNYKNINEDENSFYYIAGFETGSEKNISMEGKRMVDRVNQQIAMHRSGGMQQDNINIDFDTAVKTISDSWSGSAKDIHLNPVQWLRGNRLVLRKHIEDNAILLDRYRAITLLSKYRNTLTFDFDSPFLRYRSFIDAARLDDVSIVHEFLYENSRSALTKLQQRISFSRMLLVEAQNFLEKMIAVAMLDARLTTYSHIVGISKGDVELISLQGLSEQEMSMLRASQGELLFMQSVTYALQRPYYNSDSKDFSSVIEYILQRIYVKPNRMVNVSHEKIWVPYQKMGELPLSERELFFREMSIDIKWWHYLRDPVGSILLDIAMPGYYSYTDKIDHLDAYIYLVNLKAEILSRNIYQNKISDYIKSISPLGNAGYHGSELIWDENKKELTFQVPGYESDRIPVVRLYNQD